MGVKEEALRVLQIECLAIENLQERIDDKFVKAVELIESCRGKVVVSGIGKSGLIGQKISSTLSSTGTPSFFLHPSEGSHGDLGVIASPDLVLAISYGGESQEMHDLISYCTRKDIPMLSMTGSPKSTLAKSSLVSLDISVKEEACPLKLAPTASSTATLALGDALAMAVLQKKGFRREDFAEFHPGGSLGRKLLTRVKDIMHVAESLPLVQKETSLAETVGLMTAKEVRGVAGVIDNNQSLIGVITDGDIRRQIERKEDIFKLLAQDLMSRNPKTIECTELAERALFVMEQFQIQTLFVVDKASEFPQKPVGLLHLQDLLRAKIR